MAELISNLIGKNDYTNEEVDLIKASKGRPQEVVDYIVKDYDNLGICEDALYIFNGKYYEPLKEGQLHQLIYSFYKNNGLRGKFNLSKEREVAFSIRNNDKMKFLEFDKSNIFINLNNGVFNLESYELLPHDRKYQFSYCLDVDYKPGEESCPTFVKFLQGVFATSGNWDDGYVTDVDEIENVLRMCGYLIYPRLRKEVEKMFILLGEGANGKSVLIDVIKMFFPRQFITSMSLSVIADENSFSRESIMHSKVNICSEQRGGNIDSEELKKVISGDLISVQRKFIGGAANLEPKTKILVATNNMPYFNDTTFGTTRRLQIFHFKNRFVEDYKYEKEINPEKYRIFKQLNKEWLENNFEKEKSAIFNLFLEGLMRFRNDNWHFLETDAVKDIVEDYKANSDVLGTWLNDHFVVGDGEFDFISNNSIYNQFCDYYDFNYRKRTTHSTNSIGRKIREKFRLEPIKSYENGKQVYGYNLKLKDDDDSAIKSLISINPIGQEKLI